MPAEVPGDDPVLHPQALEVGAVTFAIASTDLEGRPTDIAGGAVKINPKQVSEPVGPGRDVCVVRRRGRGHP